MSINAVSNSRNPSTWVSQGTVSSVFGKLGSAKNRLDNALGAENIDQEKVFKAKQELQQATQLVEALNAMQDMLSKLIDNIINSLKRIGQEYLLSE